MTGEVGFPSPSVVAAVVAHMNGEHADDAVLICRALGDQPDAVRAIMLDFDAEAARYRVVTGTGEVEVAVPWPALLTERAQIRAAVVEQYEQACAALGVAPRPRAEH